MKEIITVDEYKVNSCKRRMEEGYGSWYDELIAKGLVIDDNRTRGEVIKSMFPNVKFIEHTESRVVCGYIDIVYPTKRTIKQMEFDLIWWQQPFNNGGK